jgi:hypothetical protein
MARLGVDGGNGRRPTVQEFQNEDQRTENQAAGHAHQNLCRMRREDKDESLSFDEGGEAGDAKWHEKKAERLPEIQTHLVFVSYGRAEVKSKSNDQAQTQRSEP